MPDQALLLLQLLRRLQLPLFLLAVCLAPGAASASTSVECDRTLDEELPSDRDIVDLGNLLASRGHQLPAYVRTEFQIFNAAPSGTERYFKVHRTTGLLSTARRLDRDRLCQEVPGACCDRAAQCRITLQVQSDKEFSYIIRLAVTINDINDNAPRWSSLEVTREFSEAASPGESRALPLAEDADSIRFGVQRYEILPPQPPEFELEYSGPDASSSLSSSLSLSSMADPNINAQSLRLVLRQPLDRESRDSYEFTLMASDGGNPPLNGTVRVRVLVADENDEYPVFEHRKYSKTVRENLPVGSEILQVKATDRDAGLNAKLTYSIPSFAQRRIHGLFAVDSATGVLRLIGSLDYEQARQHSFKVVAEDQSPAARRQGATQIVIRVEDVNDERPSISVNPDTVSVSENLSSPRTVTIVTVADKDSGDNGRVHCELTRGRDMFSLEPLDSSEPSSSGSAVSAASGSAGQPLGPADPVLYQLATVRSLDREADGIHSRPVSAVIQCADMGRPSNTVSRTVHVDIEDVNDHAPEFVMQHFHFNVNERTRVGTEVFVLRASDKDYGANARLAYRLNGTNTFDVTPDGRVSLRERLDRESRPQLEFTALAVDHGLPALTGSARVIVRVKDDNDHHPVIQGYFAFRVLENATIGHLIGQLNATDADEGPNALLTYRLASSSHSNTAALRLPFRVHSDGRITVSDRLDRETKERYELAVVVSDSPPHPSAVRSASATVIIDLDDVNDCRPRFLFPSSANRTLVVPTGAPLSAQLGRLVAEDADADGNGRLFYYITAPSSTSTSSSTAYAGPFHVDPDSGLISLVQPLTQAILARPPVLTVTVRDGGHPPLESVQTLRIVFRQSTRLGVDSASGDFGSRAHSESGGFGGGVAGGGDGAGGSGGGRVGVSSDSSDSMVVIAGSLIAVTVAFVLMLLVAFALLSCRRRIRGSQSDRNRRNLGAPIGLAGNSSLGGGAVGGIGEKFIVVGGPVGGYAEDEAGRSLTMQGAITGVHGGGYYEDGSTIKQQQQQRRSLASQQQQQLLQRSASSSLAMAEEDPQSNGSCEEAGGAVNVIGTSSFSRKQQQLQQRSGSCQNPAVANNYESLMLLRGRKAADGAEMSGNALEYYRLHYTTVQQQHQQSGSDLGDRSQKPTPPPLLTASYV